MHDNKVMAMKFMLNTASHSNPDEYTISLYQFMLENWSIIACEFIFFHLLNVDKIWC